jgi:hypothetical protein
MKLMVCLIYLSKWKLVLKKRKRKRKREVEVEGSGKIPTGTKGALTKGVPS